MASGMQYSSVMGRLDNTKILYVCGGLILAIGIFFALLLNTKTSGFFRTQGDKAGISSVSQPRIGRHQLNPNAPRAQWTRISAENDSTRAQRYDSGHNAGNSYASNYVAPQEIYHPLVASTKFIKKKDKAKKKGSKLAKDKDGKLVKAARYNADGSLAPLSESEDEEMSVGNASAAGVAGGGAGAVQAKKTDGTEEDEENINTVEFWEEPIFVNVDPAAVSKLVTSYQGKQVSNNIFYTVVTQMNEDGRVEVRELGLVALAATPSVQSFSNLTWVKHNDTEPALRTEASRQVASYTDAARLGYVVTALRPSSAENANSITVEALRSLTDSTVKYGNLQANHEGTPTTGRSQADILSVLEPRYERALQIIEQNYTNSSDAMVKTEATKTVAAINKFMSI